MMLCVANRNAEGGWWLGWLYFPRSHAGNTYAKWNPGGGRQCLGNDTFWFGVLRSRHGIFFLREWFIGASVNAAYCISKSFLSWPHKKRRRLVCVPAPSICRFVASLGRSSVRRNVSFYITFFLLLTLWGAVRVHLCDHRWSGMAWKW